MSCIFCAIVAEQAPASRIHESTNVLAFMSIHPSAPGECLVIPKQHIDHFTDLSPDLAADVMATAHRIARAMRRAFEQQRVGYVVHGYGVSHAHMILVPQQGPYHITSDRFARVVDGHVVFDLAHIVEPARPALDSQAARLREVFEET